MAYIQSSIYLLSHNISSGGISGKPFPLKENVVMGDSVSFPRTRTFPFIPNSPVNMVTRLAWRITFNAKRLLLLESLMGENPSITMMSVRMWPREGFQGHVPWDKNRDSGGRGNLPTGWDFRKKRRFPSNPTHHHMGVTEMAGEKSFRLVRSVLC